MCRRVIRVVQVCSGYSPGNGGTTTSVLQFQQALGGSVVAFQRAGETTPAAASNVVEVACRSGFLGHAYSWAAGRSLFRAKDALKDADLVVCHMLYQYHIQWGARTARMNGVPYWVVPHGSLDPYVMSYRSLRKRLWLTGVGREILHRAERVIFATQRERTKAETTVGSLSNASVLRWPVDLAGVANRAERRARTRAALGIGPSQRALVYMGRLHSMKRPLETMTAVGKLVDHDVCLVVVGPDGDLTRTECEAMCQANGWRNVHVVGSAYGADRDDYYMAADGFISLSWRENFGHSVAEALAFGLPVILGPGIDLARDLGATPCGWMLSDVAEQSVSRAVTEFASASPESLALKGEMGRAWAQQELAPSRFAVTVNAMAEHDVLRTSVGA